MGLELVDQPRFVLDRRFASVEAGLPDRLVFRCVIRLMLAQLLPESGDLCQRRDQGVVVVGQGDSGLEHFTVPLRVELLHLADQVAGFGVAAGLVGGRLDVQEHQDRGQQQGHGAQQQLDDVVARESHDRLLIKVCPPIGRSGS